MFSLIGFKASGKTTVGKMLAKRLALPWIDTDEQIQHHLKKPIGEIYHALQEKKFRQLECNVLQSLAKQAQVISTGGGVVTHPLSMRYLKDHTHIFYLKADFNTLATRITTHPVFAHRQDLFEIYQSRIPLYEDYADDIIDTQNDPIDTVLARIMEKIHGQ